VSFDSDERSIEQNRPIELYTITTPTATYRLTSYTVDVTYAGNTYTATTMDRGDQQVSQDPTGRELIVYLPIAHPVVQRFASKGVPEHTVTVILQRLQTVSGVAIQQWAGFAQSISIDGHTALVRVPSVCDDAIKIRLPVVVSQRICNHVLFDARCSPLAGIDGPAEIAFTIITTIGSQSGRTVSISSINGNPDEWATFGYCVHQPSLEYRYIQKQTGTLLTLDSPFTSANIGDGIGVVAGCAHDIITCRFKFGNVLNFGGMPNIVPTINPWAPKGLGVVQQT
jgi:hypothetical protein